MAIVVVGRDGGGRGEPELQASKCVTHSKQNHNLYKEIGLFCSHDGFGAFGTEKARCFALF